MNKKDAIFPFIFVGLSFLFILASLLVFVTRGKSVKWVARKMKIGALLLSLNATISACRPIRTCYAVPAPNQIWLSDLNSDNKLVLKQSNTIVKGTINIRTSEFFSFAIADTSSNILQKGKILPDDGKYNSELEEVTFTIKPDIAEGEYILLLYDVGTGLQQKDYLRNKFSLIIKK